MQVPTATLSAITVWATSSGSAATKNNVAHAAAASAGRTLSDGAYPPDATSGNAGRSRTAANDSARRGRSLVLYPGQAA